MSDVPLGAMLSGGLDSSLLVAMMARSMTEPVKTFSVGFVEDGDGYELGDARHVASAFGADHHELELSMSDTTTSLEDLVWALDEPLADLSALGFKVLCELAAQHVTVAIAGQGADELFAGYSRAPPCGARRAKPVAAAAGRGGGGVRARQAGGRYARFAGALRARDSAARYLLPSRAESRRDAAARARPRPPPHRSRNAAAAVARHAGGLDGGPLADALFLDAQLGLVDDMLHYSDRVSMAHSLEVRVPFLDHRVVEFCAPRSRPRSRSSGGTTKYLLKQIARGLVPDRIIDKPKTGFFNLAVDSMAPSPARRRVGRLPARRPTRVRGVHRPWTSVARLVAERLAGKPVSGDALYALLDARGLALDASCRARFLRRASVSRRPREVSRALRTRSSRPRGTRRRIFVGSPTAWPRRRMPPRSG